MRRVRPPMPLLVVVAALALGSCSMAEPHVYDPGRFNRNLPTFGQEPADRVSVVICFSRWATPDAEVERMASAECGKFGKQARAISASVLTCPLTTPVGVQFQCVKS